MVREANRGEKSPEKGLRSTNLRLTLGKVIGSMTNTNSEKGAGHGTNTGDGSEAKADSKCMA